MRPQSPTQASKLHRRSPRLALEQLEDRCVPSANMMPSMGMSMMNMQPINMGMMSTQSMSTNMQSMGTNMMTFQQEASAFAALDRMFMNFEHVVQQLITQEVAMLQTFFTDLSHLTMMPGSPAGGMK
jgi:hypothetical protein